MKLSKDQIEQLKNLISYKGYQEIDVQYEILDHVACKVEALMEKKPNLQIDDAFRKVFASFGSKGFNELEASYQKMIWRKHRFYFWEELKLFLFSYKVLIVMGIFLTFYYFRDEFDSKNGWIGGLMMLFLSSAVVIVGVHWGKFKKFRKYASFNATGKLFRLLITVYQLCSFSFLMLINSIKNETIWSTYKLLTVTVVLALLHCCLFILPKVFERSHADTEKLTKLYQTNS